MHEYSKPKSVWFVFIVAIGMLGAISCQAAPASYVPEGGFVSDARTAIAIGEAVLTPIYGDDVVRSERPYRAVLKGRVWTVTGSLPYGKVGGVALVEIDKFDGKILRLIHGK